MNESNQVEDQQICSHVEFFITTQPNSVNQTTSLLTPVNTLDLMIGYGTINSYRIYEIDELNLAFGFSSLNHPPIFQNQPSQKLINGRLRSGLLPISSISNNGRRGRLIRGKSPFDLQSHSEIEDLIGSSHESSIDSSNYVAKFRKPDDPIDQFTDSEIWGLSTVLSKVKSNPNHLSIGDKQSIDELLFKIKIGMKIKHNTKLVNQTQINKLKQVSNLQKDLIREWLLELFRIGMYMRRWAGPGFPYPVSEKDTLLVSTSESTVDPIHQQRAITGFLKLKQLEDQLSPDLLAIIHSLAGFNLIRGKIKMDRISIGSRLNVITTQGESNVKACIRSSSTILIGTGYVYLLNLYQYKIPHFNPSLIDQIA